MIRFRGSDFPVLRSYELIRYLGAAVLHIAIAYVCFVLMVWLVDGSYILALILSSAVGSLVAFGLYRFWVFRARGNVLREFALFLTVYLLALGLNACLLFFAVSAFGLEPWLGQLLCLFVVGPVSFFGHRALSFATALRDP